MSPDDIDHIPSIVPTRDNEPPASPSTVRAGRARGAGTRLPAGGGKPPAGSGSGAWIRLLLTASLVVAAVACVWAWQLQEQLHQTGTLLENYAQRIGDLEDRLSDTDEGMSQNAAVQAAKLRELDTEVRKLWDNVWKKSKERLDALEASSRSQGKKLDATETSIASTRKGLEGAAADIARLKSVAGDLERLMASARANQAEVERVADTLNRINLDISKLNNRVASNEEAMRSVDAFRRQVMSSLSDLQAAVRILQAEP